MVFPKYRKYRNTGVDWIGHIPDHWSTKAVKYVSLVNPSGDRAQKDEQVTFLPMEAVLTNGQFDASRVDVRNTFPASLTEFKRGDVLLAKITPCFENGKGTFVEELPTLKGIGSTEFHVFRVCKDQLTPRFLYYAIHNEAFRTYAEVFMEGTAGQKRVTTPFISNTKIPVPPIEDQKRIVEFLDRKTSEIDQAIAQKQRLIELLQEQKSILINQAVTKGLNPNTPMQDSGIEWLGKIPKHWKVSRLKHAWEIIDCKHLTAPFTDEGYPLASIQEVQSKRITLKRANRTNEKFYRKLIEGGRKPKIGDIVYSRNATVGAASLVDFDEDFALGQDVCLLRSSQNNGSFFVHQLRADIVLGQLNQLLVGSTFNRINISQIKELLVCIPPAEEQKKY